MRRRASSADPGGLIRAAAILALCCLGACGEDEPGAGGGTDASSDINRQRPEPDLAGDMAGVNPDVAADVIADAGDQASEDVGDAAGEAGDEPVPDAVVDVPADDPAGEPDATADLPPEDLPQADGPLPPVAVAGDDLAGLAGAPIQVDGSASYDPDGTLTQWNWIFGDGSEDDGETVFHTYTAPGIYVAELTVVDDDGLTAKDTVTITIGAANAPPRAVIEGPHDVVQNEEASFDGRDSSDDGSIASWHWDVAVAGVAPIAGSTLDYTWLDWGEYTLTLTVEDDLGATDTAEHLLTVLAPPVAIIDAVTTTTVGTLVSFDGSDSYDEDGVVEEWLWEFPDGSTQDTPIVTYTFGAAGEPEVVLTVTDDDGLESSATHKIGVTGGGGDVDLAGIWALDPDPSSGESWSSISYSCAFGFVSLSFDALEVQQSASALAGCQEPPGMPCLAASTQPGRLTGPLPLGGAFEIDNIYPGGSGGCDEIYTLDAELVGADEFRGTFRAEFVGGACSLGDCFSQEWTVRGLRVD